MSDLNTFIGGTLYVAASETVETETAYLAKTMTEIGMVVSIGDISDKAENVTVNLLKEGRTVSVNGVRAVDPIAVNCVFDAADAGQAIIKAGNNGVTKHTFKILDVDGIAYFFQGVPASVSYGGERTASAYKAFNFEIRTQTAIMEIDTNP